MCLAYSTICSHLRWGIHSLAERLNHPISAHHWPTHRRHIPNWCTRKTMRCWFLECNSVRPHLSSEHVNMFLKPHPCLPLVFPKKHSWINWGGTSTFELAGLCSTRGRVLRSLDHVEQDMTGSCLKWGKKAPFLSSRTAKMIVKKCFSSYMQFYQCVIWKQCCAW